MRTKILRSLIGGLFVAVVGCAGETAEPIEVMSESGALLGVFEPDGAPSVGMQHFFVHVGPASGEPMTGDHGTGPTMRVEPWMPAHGHGSPSEVIVTALGGGEFEMDVHFSMSGYWELTVVLTTPHGDETFVVPVEVR